MKRSVSEKRKERILSHFSDIAKNSNLSSMLIDESIKQDFFVPGNMTSVQQVYLLAIQRIIVYTSQIVNYHQIEFVSGRDFSQPSANQGIILCYFHHLSADLPYTDVADKK